jgi:hypothetical protein
VLARYEWGRGVEGALGLAVLLTVTNAAGTVGALGGSGSVWVGWGLLLPGLWGAVRVAREAMKAEWDGRSPWRWLAYAPAGFVVAAACSPPGWLFESEGGGYDSLSYHLQLPREWIEGGGISPSEHNVFSWFPSFVEGAFLHIGAVTAGAEGFGSGGGWRLLSCQMLHALMAVQCAAVMGEVVRVVCRGREAARVEWAVAVVRVAFLVTPWTVVVGALSYNEMPLLTFLCAGMLVVFGGARGAGLTVGAGLVLGVLVGAAIGAKPTAVVFVGAPLAVAALVRVGKGGGVRGWAKVGAVGVGAMVAVLVPWLVRNGMEGANPIFPLGMGVLGTNHWTGEQAGRFVRAVSFGGSVVERLKLMVLEDATDPSGPRHRGMLHPQWLGLWLVAPVVGVMAMRRGAREVGGVLCVVLGVQVCAWLFATHIQARFLLPCVPVVLVMMAVVVAGWSKRWVVGLMVLMGVRGIAAYDWYSGERGGAPNQWVDAGPGFFGGELQAELKKELLKGGGNEEEWGRVLLNSPPAVVANLKGLRRVYLLGDATPLYWNNVVYNTTWDRWLFAEALAAGEDPWVWTERLRERGVTHVFVNGSELARLGRSGLIDPTVTVERVSRWLETCAEPVRVWPEVGCSLVELRVKERP